MYLVIGFNEDEIEIEKFETENEATEYYTFVADIMPGTKYIITERTA